MKNQMTMMLAVCGLMAGVSLNAEKTAHKPQVVTSSVADKVAESTKLSVEELAFAAKLSDSNRKVFIEKLTVEQRLLAMAAAKSATVADAADEAVSKILSGAQSEAVKSAAVAVAEEACAALEEAESNQAE